MFSISTIISAFQDTTFIVAFSATVSGLLLISAIIIYIISKRSNQPKVTNDDEIFKDSRKSTISHAPPPAVSLIINTSADYKYSTSEIYSNNSTEKPKRDSTISLIQLNQEFIVIRGYTATEYDEMTINMNNIVQVLKIYDDGWVLGLNKETGNKGVIPSDCLKMK